MIEFSLEDRIALILASAGYDNVSSNDIKHVAAQVQTTEDGIKEALNEIGRNPGILTAGVSHFGIPHHDSDVNVTMTSERRDYEKYSHLIYRILLTKKNDRGYPYIIGTNDEQPLFVANHAENHLEADANAFFPTEEDRSKTISKIKRIIASLIIQNVDKVSLSQPGEEDHHHHGE